MRTIAIDDGEGMPIDNVYPSKSQYEKAEKAFRKRKNPSTSKKGSRQL